MKSSSSRRNRIQLAAVLVASVSVCRHIDSFVPIRRRPVHTLHCGAASRKRYRCWDMGATNRNSEASELAVLDSSASLQTDGDKDQPALTSRRSVLLHGAFLATTTAAVIQPRPASAGVPEVDKTGELYSPKSQMLRGGSDAARGIKQRSSQSKKLLPGKSSQSVYGTRFIAYLTRFLLTFDPPSHAWWVQQGFEDSWEQELKPPEYDTEQSAKFAEFAESVEMGLADYFVGPYGSYASVSAAKAGLLASAPAVSLRPKSDRWKEKTLFERLGIDTKKQVETKQKKGSPEKQGILNLYALLKARYTSNAAKRQLSILFSFITDPELQPASEIQALLGEADNANVTTVEFVKSPIVENEAESRTSSRRGGGYSIEAPPKVEVQPPSALGDEFRQATCSPVLRPTSRVLRINVTDGGEGYTAAPAVSVRQSGSRKQCEACAILDRSGRVESIIVLHPGYGYGQTGKGFVPPKVIIEGPKRKQGNAREKKGYRRARAVSELEYEIVGVKLVHGGNGYVATEPVGVTITPPNEDPDWYVSSAKSYGSKPSISMQEDNFPTASVTGMGFPDGSTAHALEKTTVTQGLIDLLRREQLDLLPSSIRPEPLESQKLFYSIPALPKAPQFFAVPSPRYRAYDPIFGGIGSVPVQKGASELQASEYGRLALSGAVCTVIVRTALNPLELVKTKVQLKNDQELNNFAYRRAKERRLRQGSGGTRSIAGRSEEGSPGDAAVSENGTLALKTRETTEIATIENEEEILTLGTIDMIKAIADFRGPLALFQSADITFLASLVFGSFGFGATELFRRSFTSVFFSDGSSDGLAEIVLLAAAALATIVTSAAASPFEVLRVRSMGLVEAKPWKEVLEGFLEENPGPRQKSEHNRSKQIDDMNKEFRLQDLRPADVLPLWKGFAPTVSRELPFAVTKFLAFDLIAKSLSTFVNNQAGEGAMPIQVGVGATGLAISAFAGAIAGVAGAFVSHPADLILTLTSTTTSTAENAAGEESTKADWRELLQDLLSREGGIANLFIGLPARSAFFFLVIGLQFFLYDYVKTLFQVGLDDLSLVLDVFYAVRQGLVDQVS